MFHPKGTSFGRREIDDGKKPSTHRGMAPDSHVRTNQPGEFEWYIHQVSIIVPLRCRGLFRSMMPRKHSAAPAAFPRHHRTEKAG